MKIALEAEINYAKIHPDKKDLKSRTNYYRLKYAESLLPAINGYQLCSNLSYNPVNVS